MNSGRAEDKDDEISVISSIQARKLYSQYFVGKKQSQRSQWHSDITFEPVPSDYALLRLTQLPKTGGGESRQLLFSLRRMMFLSVGSVH